MDDNERAVPDNLGSLIETLLAGIRLVDREGEPSIAIDADIADLIDAHSALLAPAVDDELAQRQTTAGSKAEQRHLGLLHGPKI